ncbi:MAG: autotransporter outer membrane beta-barrel domain-containing protein, partial [Clostridia bacterium]|nr:autotransporter outer membrane beta-barrel domain-containing protein [Clostridia bacterium]
TIIDAGTGVTGAFSSVAGDNGLLITNTVDIDEINFDVTVTTTLLPASSVGDLNENQTNVGDALIDILSEADIDPGLTDYIASIGAISDAGELGFVLSELSPEGFDAGLRFLAQSQGRFMSAVALRSPQPSQDGPYVWGAIDLSHLSKNEDAQNQGFKGDIREFSAGVSGLGRGPVRFGVAGGYATFNGETDAGLSDEADAKLYRLAASAQVLIDGAGANGRIDNVFGFAAGESELSMRVADPASSAPILQSGEADIRSFGFASRFTVTGVNGRDWAIHPHAEVGLDSVKQDAALVGSDQPTALSVEEVGSTRAHIGLGASFARRLMDRLTLRASATGLRYFGDTQNVFHARLAGAPTEASAFDILGISVEWQARMRAGAMYEHKSGFTLSADVFGEAGDVNAYGARFELSKGF